jgi:hypothetical protein
MKIPKRIKIGGCTYRVIMPYVFRDNESCLVGMCDTSLQEIKIATVNQYGEKRHEEALEHTLMHEILHAVDFVYGCEIGNKGSECEDIIDQLARGLLQVIRDNRLNFAGTGRVK